MKMTKAQAKQLGIQLNGTDWIHKAKPKSKHGKKPAKPVGGCPLFLAACREHGLPVPVAEYRFHPTRLWRWDWLFDSWLALEVQGGLYVNGGHNRGRDMEDEYVKIAEGIILGYSVMLTSTGAVEKGSVFPLIARALAAKDEQS